MVATSIRNGAETEGFSCWKFENTFQRKEAGKHAPKCSSLIVKNQQNYANP